MCSTRRQQRLGDVVGLYRAAREVDDRDSEARHPVAAQVVAQAHRARGVVAHGRYPTVGRARAQREHRGGSRRQQVDPGVGEDRLSGGGIDAHPRPVPFAVDLLVGDRAFEHEDERVEVALRGVCERPQEVGAGLEREHRVVQHHRRHPGQSPAQEILEARAGRRRHRDRVAVAAQAAGDPKDAHRWRRLRAGCHAPVTRWSRSPSDLDSAVPVRCARSETRCAASRLPWRCQSPALPVTSPARASRPRACEIDGRSAATSWPSSRWVRGSVSRSPAGSTRPQRPARCHSSNTSRTSSRGWHEIARSTARSPARRSADAAAPGRSAAREARAGRTHRPAARTVLVASTRQEESRSTMSSIAPAERLQQIARRPSARSRCDRQLGSARPSAHRAAAAPARAPQRPATARGRTRPAVLPAPWRSPLALPRDACGRRAPGKVVVGFEHVGVQRRRLRPPARTESSDHREDSPVE